MVSLSLSPWASITDNSLFPLLSGLDCKFVESPARGSASRFSSAPESNLLRKVPPLFPKVYCRDHQTRNTKRLSVHLILGEILIDLKPTPKTIIGNLLLVFIPILLDWILKKRLQSRWYHLGFTICYAIQVLIRQRVCVLTLTNTY